MAEKLPLRGRDASREPADFPTAEQLSPEDRARIRKGQEQTQRMRAERIADGNWNGLLGLYNSEERLRALEQVWNRIPHPDRPTVFASAYGGADFTSRDREFVLSVLREFRGEGRRVFTNAYARHVYRGLPQRPVIYRGGVRAELPDHVGFSWTLEEQVARKFTSDHHRVRQAVLVGVPEPFRSSPAVILRAELPKESICGVLTGRREREILVLPDLVEGLSMQSDNREGGAS